ncbi:small ubiquitin-related modifier 1-like [Salvia miltiorrhiza]|uniref:small ubiquitin-related modifier 1-like n=1 Tax=Salvia miltiorrhiza TaxID=226208 RepID=UPI0025AD8C47|nr:small ubiquitin-related modifier 1-like [Salvia miltiorrhiza]
MVKKVGGGGTTNANKINVSIKSQDGDTIFFRVSRHKSIQDMLKVYCQQKNFKYSEMSFIHEGNRIPRTKTVFELGIEDGDEIDAMKHQGGGGNPMASTT